MDSIFNFLFGTSAAGKKGDIKIWAKPRNTIIGIAVGKVHGNHDLIFDKRQQVWYFTVYTGMQHIIAADVIDIVFIEQELHESAVAGKVIAGPRPVVFFIQHNGVF